MNTNRIFIVCLALAMAAETSTQAEPTLEWYRTFGTNAWDEIKGVAADGLGNVYVSGSSGSDAFVAKYDAGGTLQWMRQFGSDNSDSSDEAFDVSIDGLGSVYVVGQSDRDAFLANFDASGTMQWMQQFGSSEYDQGSGVFADALGYIYVAGYTTGSLGGPHAGDSDAFVAKYDAGGTIQWMQQLGTVSEDKANGVSADELGNVYITGSTEGSPGYYGAADMLVAKYDADGALQWTEQSGTRNWAWGQDISADGSGNVFITSVDYDHINDYTGRITNLGADGTLKWSHQLESSSARGVWADELGSFYIVENDGEINLGDIDAWMFVSKYDSDGTLRWSERLIDQPNYDVEEAWAVSADRLGNVFVGGVLKHLKDGYPADGFVAKFVDLPALDGDFDGNGRVDGADFLAWQRGESPSPLSPSDLVDWQTNFGLPGASAQSDAIPEPMSVWLVTLGMIALSVLPKRAVSGPSHQKRGARV